MTTKPMNVLFIITDQQRADHNGFMGNEVVKTPNLDQLASSGMVFENTWVSNPVCMPNRSTIMTGRMPSSHGVIFNDRSLDPLVNTFVKRFREAGYRTGLIGKSHLQHGMSKNSMVPYRGAPSSFSDLPEGWDQVEDFERYVDGSPEDPHDFYGFDHVEFSIDHGASVAGHHLQWAIDRGAKAEDLVIDQDVDGPGSRRSENWRQIYQPPYAEEIHSTTYVTERTIAFIDEAEQQEKPWGSWCSFPDPHHPLTPPGKWFDMYRPSDMLLPESRHDPLTNAPAHLKLFAATHPRDQRNWVAPCGYGSDDLLAEALAATYGMVSMIDDGIGRIMARLDALGVRDNTIVVFTSDHGDMMGDHSLFLKGFMHYRGTLQVPLIIDAPGKEAGRTSSLASSIDLGPTLMDLCGIDDYDGLQGVSLTEALTNGTATPRASVLVEDDLPVITSQLTPMPARIRTVLMDKWKYTRNSKGEEQLFNLESDPDEMTNLTGDSTNRLRLRAAMLDQMMMADDSSRGAPYRNHQTRQPKS